MPTARYAPGFLTFFSLLVVVMSGSLTTSAFSETPSDPSGSSPLTLDTEVDVPPILLGDEAAPTPPARELTRTPLIDASPVVEVPPVVDGPSFLSLGTHTEGDSEEALPEVPSVVVEPAEPIVPPPVTPLEITLDWYLNPQHAALIVAREKGMFLRRGLDVTLASPADPNVPTKLLAAGRTDLSLGRQLQLHLEVDKDLPLIRVATLIDSPLSALVMRQDSLNGEAPEEGSEPSKQRLDLRLGYTVQDSQVMLESRLVSPATNGAPTRLTLEDVNYSILDAMRGERLDGVVVNQRHLLPRQLADEGIGTQTLRVEEHGLPSHDGLILMANRERLNGKRDAIRQLVAALEEASLWIINHPEEAWALLIAAEPALDHSSMHDAWKEILPRLSQRPSAVDQGRYHRFEQLLLEAGAVQAATPVERLAVDLGRPEPGG